MTTDILPGCEPFSSPGSTDGVLVLHGYTGNPLSMRPLAELIAQQGYTVELPLLPGHGTSVADLSTKGWTDWFAAMEEVYDDLRERCDRVVAVGLSMGGALATFLAERHEELAGLVLINPIVQPPDEATLGAIQQMVDGGTDSIESIGSDIKKEGSVEASYEATPLRPVLTLFDGVAVVRQHLNRITAPVLLFSSREDHVVTSDNGDALVENVQGPIERVWLEDSFHVATLDNDAPLVEAKTLSFLEQIFTSE